MPALQAEESLLEVTRLSVGSGNMKPSASSEIIDDWHQALNEAIPLPKKPTSSPAAMLAFARTARARVVSVPVSAPVLVDAHDK